MTETPPWLSNALESPAITDICLNGPLAAFADRGDGMEPLPNPGGALWSCEEELRSWVLDRISSAGKTWDARHPFIDARLETGHRLHVAFPPLTTAGILVSLRRLPSDGTGCAPRGARWTASPRFAFLAERVAAGESLLIAGATGSGKTTLANDLLEAVPATERIVSLEDTPELAPRHPHFVSLLSRPPNADGCGEVTLRTLLRQALRMRPDRIVLGECRGAEVLDLLQALNTGHRGSLATLHANSPRDALRRVELLCLLAASGSIPLGAIRELLASGVQWVAQVRRVGRTREIAEIWRVEGREGDTILMRPVIEP